MLPKLAWGSISTARQDDVIDDRAAAAEVISA
jgi:hypothetical protein